MIKTVPQSTPCVWGLMLLLSALILSNCGPATVQSIAIPTASPTGAAPQVPDPTAARNAALTYLSECYSEEAPALDLHWTEERITPKGVAGPSTLQYHAEDWVITLSFPLVAPQATVYQVVVFNQTTGFRWEGEVDAAGQVTGHALVPAPPSAVAEDLYPGWASYVNTDYRFSFHYPPTWTLEHVSGSEKAGDKIVPSLMLSQGTLTLVIGFEHARRGIIIESEAGPGEWESRGAVTFMGQRVPRMVLVYEGKHKAVFFNGTSPIQADDLVFHIALIDVGADYQAIAISKDLQAEVDQIVESFERVVIRYCYKA